MADEPHLLLSAILDSPAGRPVLVAGHVVHGELAGRNPGDVGFEVQHVLAGHDAEEALFPPVLAPAIAHVPKLLAIVIHTPSRDGDDVIRPTPSMSIVVEHYPAREIVQRASVHTSGHGPTGVDLLLDVDHVEGKFCSGTGPSGGGDYSVLRHSGVGVVIERDALAPAIAEGATGAARVRGRAGRVHVAAESFAGFAGASEVGLASTS